MPLCVKVLPAQSPLVYGAVRDSHWPSMYDVIVVDQACNTGLSIYTQDEITALVSAGPGTGPDADYLAQLGIDGPTVALVLAAGAAPVIGSYLMGWVIGLAKGIIKKI